MNEEQVGKAILDAAFKVHTALGPGLLESVYEAALALELSKQGLTVERQKAVEVSYDTIPLDIGFRADLIVNGVVLVELKSVEALLPVHKKTATSYLRLIPLKLGFLINFNEAHLKDGIVRVVNGVEGKPFLSVDLRKGAERQTNQSPRH
jgi:GxxExxY protein